MTRVLVIDDEQDCREELELALGADGHEVKGAASGRSGIDVGARFRPDVLVADWMLKNHFHGLHVSQVLRAVNPSMQTILITGFSSEDLRAEAHRAQIFDFIEKPFDVQRIQSAVRRAANTAATAAQELPKLAVVEIDADGAIVHANALAARMFAETKAGANPARISDVLPGEKWSDLLQTTAEWVAVSPRTNSSIRWALCIQPEPVQSTRLVVLRHEDEPAMVRSSLIEMLLAFAGPSETAWPMTGRALVVDDDPMVRRVILSTLEFSGARCFPAATYADALRLFAHDEGIQCVIVDYSMPEGDVAGFVKRLRAIRPDAVIVGNSATARGEEFQAAGVDRFLTKPWRIEALIDVLTGRIEKCRWCALRLPLRHGLPGDEIGTWVCCGCGTRYEARFDRDAPPDTFGNVRHVDAAP